MNFIYYIKNIYCILSVYEIPIINIYMKYYFYNFLLKLYLKETNTAENNI